MCSATPANEPATQWTQKGELPSHSSHSSSNEEEDEASSVGETVRTLLVEAVPIAFIAALLLFRLSFVLEAEILIVGAMDVLLVESQFYMPESPKRRGVVEATLHQIGRAHV